MDILKYTVRHRRHQLRPTCAWNCCRAARQQAVAIARAVHFKNKMLLLDEPTSALSVRETGRSAIHRATAQ